MRAALAGRLVPELKRRGFVGPDKIDGNRTSHEYTRTSGSGTEHLVVQFDKHKRPRFILNVWVMPSGGLDELIKRGVLFIQGRVAPRPGPCTSFWFRADRPWWHRLVGKNSTLENEAVAQALSYFDAIEDWFRDPRATSHVRIIWCDYSNTEECLTSR